MSTKIATEVTDESKANCCLGATFAALFSSTLFPPSLLVVSGENVSDKLA